MDLYQKPANGNGQQELLLHGGVNTFVGDWSSDGKWIVYGQTSQTTALDLWLLSLDGDRKPIPYLLTPFNETNARFAPGLGCRPLDGVPVERIRPGSDLRTGHSGERRQIDLHLRRHAADVET